MPYTEISQSKFESVLSEFGKWEILKDPNVKENIYLLNGCIKIYSSIVDGISRGVGDDAIRVIVWDSIANLPVKSSEARVYRIDTWAKNLRERLQKVRSGIMEMKRCRVCGSFCMERINSQTGEKFDVCLNYKNHKPNTVKVGNNVGKNINTNNDNNDFHRGNTPPIQQPAPMGGAGNTIQFQPSKYQEAIFKFIREGKGHGVIKAGAGCSKTTVLVKGVEYIPKGLSVLFLAFNKHIVTELASRLPKTADVRTAHSHAFRAVKNTFGNVEVDEYKQRNIIWEILNHSDYQKEEQYDIVSVTYKLCSLVKANLLEVNENTISDLMDYYGIVSKLSPSKLTEMVSMAIDLSLKNKRTVDYDDMIYFALKYNLQLLQYDFVLCDEAQDLSSSQLELVLRSVKPNGRIIAVGDENQAIYSFRGANAEAIPSMIKRLNATVLPLSITYRCLLYHVKLANKLVPELEARSNATEGTIKNIDYNEFFDIIKSGDMAICRNNAPLVRPAFELLSRGMKVAIKGKDIGENIVNIIKKLNTNNMKEFFRKLNAWRENELLNCQKKGTSPALIEDKYEVLLILSKDCDSVQCIINKIKTIFSDEKTAITFSSIHKAKGLEASVVFILEPQLMPSKHVVQQWEKTQEKNLLYVAVTRSKDKLYFVSEDGNKGLNLGE